MSDEEEAESNWKFMERVIPWAYAAFHRIPRIKEAMGTLFDTPVTRWEEDDEVDLTNKTLIALLQVEIEGLREALEGLSGRRGWLLLFRAKDNILYQNATGEVAEVPIGLADVISSGTPFEGDVKAHGTNLRFSVGDDVIAVIPRSLVLELRGPQSVSDGGEGGTVGGQERQKPRR